MVRLFNLGKTYQLLNFVIWSHHQSVNTTPRHHQRYICLKSMLAVVFLPWEVSQKSANLQTCSKLLADPARHQHLQYHGEIAGVVLILLLLFTFYVLFFLLLPNSNTKTSSPDAVKTMFLFNFTFQLVSWTGIFFSLPNVRFIAGIIIKKFTNQQSNLVYFTLAQTKYDFKIEMLPDPTVKVTLITCSGD